MPTREGIATFWLQADDADWGTDSNTYPFPPRTPVEGVSIECTKHPNRTLEIFINGLLDGELTYTGPVPRPEPKGVFLAVTWDMREVVLYLNDRRVRTFP